MSKVINFNYYDIGGNFSKSNTTLLKYPYLYSLSSGGQLYRLNVISHQSELMSSVDFSNLSEGQYESITPTGSCMSVGTDKMYFYALVKVDAITHRYQFCELDVETYTCRLLYNVYEMSLAIGGDIVYSMSGKVEKIDDNTIRAYHYYAYLTTGSGGSRHYVYYEVYNVNLPLLSRISLFSESQSARDTLNYQVYGYNPTITNSYYKQLLYGTYTQKGAYITKVGFTGVDNPSTIDTLDNGKYRNVGLFELNGKYYAIGGSLAGVVNTDIIQIDVNSLASTKIGESANTSIDVPAIAYTDTSVYIVFSSTLIGVAELVEYNIDYTFKDNDGNTLAELTDKLPVKEVNISSTGDTVSVTLTYIDSTTDAVFFTLPSKDNVRFFGLSNVPNSKRAMLVEGDNSVSIYNDITFYPVYVRYTVPSTTFNIELYQNSAEVNRVDKEQYLNPVGSLIGALREECSMLTPSIVYQSESVPVFNYVYIPIFNRYYFVTSLSSISKNVWRMELNCDVLMTYKNEILLLQGVIGRQENDYNLLLVDNELPTQNNPIVEVIDIPSSTFNTQTSDGGHNFILTVIGA